MKLPLLTDFRESPGVTFAEPGDYEREALLALGAVTVSVVLIIATVWAAYRWRRQLLDVAAVVAVELAAAIVWLIRGSSRLFHRFKARVIARADSMISNNDPR